MAIYIDRQNAKHTNLLLYLSLTKIGGMMFIKKEILVFKQTLKYKEARLCFIQI